MRHQQEQKRKMLAKLEDDLQADSKVVSLWSIINAAF